MPICVHLVTTGLDEESGLVSALLGNILTDAEDKALCPVRSQEHQLFIFNFVGEEFSCRAYLTGLIIKLESESSEEESSEEE